MTICRDIMGTKRNTKGGSGPGELSCGIRIRHKKGHYDRFEVVVPKGYKEKIKAAAASHNMSMNEYIYMLVCADIEGSADDEQESI